MVEYQSEQTICSYLEPLYISYKLKLIFFLKKKEEEECGV